ncbi:MAG: hypothetical protein U0936_13075 [Planctomycetaceae bacterium]
MAQAPCVSASSQSIWDQRNLWNRSRRLSLLREQLVRENRRSAAPSAIPSASRGPPNQLCHQIRDVSRIADSIAISADSASESRLQELCTDLRRLLQTQQRWTERLENQIWRLESQGKLMRRLQQVLQQGSPGPDQIWELCELIARETQALPEGLLLLPEPGHRIAIVHDGTSGFAANTIEKARLCVYAGMSILPDVRGADLAAATFLACFNRQSGWFPTTPEALPEADLRNLLELHGALESSSAAHRISDDGFRLVEVSTELTDQVELHSLKAADNLVPPGIREYYSALAATWPSMLDRDEASRELAKSVCSALGLSEPVNSVIPALEEDGDEKLVLFHKLRWHEGELSSDKVENSHVETISTSEQTSKSIRRPRFLQSTAAHGTAAKFRVFSDE